MAHNMEKWDCGLRAFVVAPAAIVVALIVGAGSVGGIILFGVAGIMLVTSATGSCPTYPTTGCIASGITCAAGTPSHGGGA